MAPPVTSQDHLVAPSDLAAQAQHLEHHRIRVPAKCFATPQSVSSSHPVLRGKVLTEKSASGMLVHLVDALAMQDFTVEAEVSACLKVTIFFEGETRFQFGEQTLTLEKDSQQAKVMTISRDEKCRMSIRDGDRRYGLYVAVTPEWFASHGFSDVTLLQRLKEHLSIQNWVLPRHLWLQARKLLEQQDTSPQGRLVREGFGMALIGEWLASIEEANQTPVRLVSRQVQRFVQYLSDEASWSLSLDMIGNHLGMSSATLQRYAREHLGMSLTQYLRKQRLNRACQALHRGEASIMEAAHIAGYSHPNNFTVAFKRQFSVPPTEVHQRSLNSLLTRYSASEGVPCVKS